MNARVLHAQVPAAAAGQRFDQVLAQLFRDYSRSRLAGWIKSGAATLDGVQVAPRQLVRGGEAVELHVIEERAVEAAPEPISLRIVHEDSALLVLDKPAGLVVHPGAGNPAGTMQNALLHHDPRLVNLPRAGIVHRLDKDTSGLLLVAKTDAAQASLMSQFGDRSIEKEYVALVRGAPPALRGRIEAPVGRDPRDRQRMAVVAGGRASVTDYAVIGSGGGYSLLTLHPRTGRTHQIRAHLAYLHLPIAGDLRYGGGIGPGGLERQFLHAARLRLLRPLDDAPLRAWSELPADLAASLQAAGIAGDDLPVGVGASVEDEP